MTLIVPDMHFHLLVLKAGLKLEILGMKRSRSPSCYSVLKKKYGYKGSREKVMAQLKEDLGL